MTMTSVTSVATMATGTEREVTARNRYQSRVGILAFCLSWLKLILVTLTTLKFSHLLKLGAFSRGVVSVEGLEHIPVGVPYTLAVNHFGGAGTTRVLGYTLKALSMKDPQAVDKLVVITGRRSSMDSPGNMIKRSVRWLVNWGFARWSDNVLRISLDEEQSIKALRSWRKVAATRPTLVFPEGKARLNFGALRPGSGLWLRNLNVPVVPVAVFVEDGKWRVSFSKPIKWCKDMELSDAQLGLAIARMLPGALTPVWNKALAR